MITESTKPIRPTLITLISVFLVFSGFVGFYYIYKGVLGSGFGETSYFALSGIVYIGCGIGFWFMRKWAVYVYAVFGLVNQVVLLLLGRWNFLSLLLLGILVFVGYKNISKMS